MSLPKAVLHAAQAAGLGTIAEKVAAGERLDNDDALALYASPDILAIGGLANHVREQRHGDISWFNRNQHINATNVCEATCIFCSFSRLETGDPGAYTMSYDEALGRLKALSQAFITEVHIVNGLNPDLPFEYYPNLLTALKNERPDLHIKGFTAVEIHYYAEKYGMRIDEVLAALRDAGLDSLPGGGAEIFADRARKKLCHDKVGSDGWIDIHRTAHRMGFRTNCTMLFGSIETIEERVDHMDRLRALQDETGGFQTFIPLKFHNENNRLRNVAETTDLDCLKTLAIGRLYLDNFAHVKAYWPMMGIQVAQLSQAFGVSDIDGTVREERIYHMAGAKTPQGLTRPDLISLIDRAGRLALERDTLYHCVAETPALTAVSGPANPTRIASVGYLNAKPLTAFLDRDTHTVVEGVPSVIAAQLEAGEVDVALVPVAAILQSGDWRVIPGPCIGAEGPVESVLLVAECPPEEWTEVLLDGESRTSAVLSKILLREGPLSKRVGDIPITPVPPGEGPARASGTTATLVIGDAARELDARFTTRIDLAEQWTRWTGLPFVFAVWAGRPDLDPRIGGELRTAAAKGVVEVPQQFTGADHTYLSERLRYTLDDRALMGLRRFAALGARAGWFENADIEMLPPERTTRTDSDLTEKLAASAPRTGPVRWAMRVTTTQKDALVEAEEQGATRARLDSVPSSLLDDLNALRPSPLALETTAAIAEASGALPDVLATAGLHAIDLDDDGPLLGDPSRHAFIARCKAAGLEILGAALFGRGESEESRIAHLDALAALGVQTLTLRFRGWRGDRTDGQGTAADWLRLLTWIQSRWSFDIQVPFETEGHAVLAVALRAGAAGVVPLAWDDTWETRAWSLDRTIRDAGYEPVRIGMETPEATGRRVTRRPVPKPQRPDIR